MRQLERRAHGQLRSFEPADHCVGVQECNFWIHRRAERPMDGDQVVRAHELVKLDIMHMAALADLRRVKNGEHVVGVDVDLRHVIALDAVPHGDRVEAKHIRQHIYRLLVTDRDVHPDNGVPMLEQPGELLNLVSLNTRVADKQHIHTLTALPRDEPAHPAHPRTPRMTSQLRHTMQSDASIA
jgi:hypothetical protein